LGELPLAAELYWQLRQQGRPVNKGFSLQRTQNRLPVWISQAQAARRLNAVGEGQQILLFTTLRYWIEHATLLSLALAGLGHDVTLAYLPYNNWRSRMNRFDLRRQNAYAQAILQPTAAIIHTVSFLPSSGAKPKDILGRIPASLQPAIRDVSLRDVQYTLQVEEIDLDSDLYKLRLERNAQAALQALGWLEAHRPDVLVTPNGSILEMGAVFQVARWLGIPVITYEFGEQRDRIWLAHNDEVMLQHTNELWAEYKNQPLTIEQENQIRTLYTSRQSASLWENFSRRWQGQPSQGGRQARQALNLNQRPIVLLAANVIGDSLTLGRQVFSQNMTEWLQSTIRTFASRPDAQLVVRVHPGERYTKGPSVADVIQQTIPELPENIRIVAASDPLNTYDLIEIADLGLVYTTTVGMEMAMSGVPVIVSGQTHYRGKGFTLDPDSWDEYAALLGQVSTQTGPARLDRSQVQLAWQYAYRFFFDYPLAFPWHLLHFWNELEEWPLERVLSGEGLAKYGAAFRYLAGNPALGDREHLREAAA
jgi:hypothetical protein